MVHYTKEARTLKNQPTGQKISLQLDSATFSVFQSPITNYCLKLFIGGQVETQLVPRLLLRIYVREVYNSMVSPPEEGVLK